MKQFVLDDYNLWGSDDVNPRQTDRQTDRQNVLFIRRGVSLSNLESDWSA